MVTATRTILINATQEELRVAMVSKPTSQANAKQSLDDFYYENLKVQQKVSNRANIIKGQIIRIEQGLNAAFVNIGGDKQAFLSLREISPEYHNKRAINNPDAQGKIQELVREGQEIMVQVLKEERGNKGAALSTYIALAGCYLVLMPNNPDAGGISRRIEGEERIELRDMLDKLTVPNGMSLIIRTAGIDRSLEDLQWDLDILLKQWEAIKQAYHRRPAPFLIHQESDVVLRTIRDHLRSDVDRIIVDNPEIFAKAKHYIERVRPDYIDRLQLYQGETSLFSRYQIEKQVKSAFEREVRLPSGGSIVIDKTEALISIDINSARATQGSDIEETAYRTNQEAADEIARQLRLRDLGGLIVIDFIDMSSIQHQRDVENRLRDALKMDRARVQIGRISRFGLLEMSRQRIHPTLGESSLITCPQCNGQGAIRSADSLGLTILRAIEEDAGKNLTKQIHVQLPLEVASFILNEKRREVTRIEQLHNIQIMLIPNPNLLVPHYHYEVITAQGQDEEEVESSHAVISKNRDEVLRDSLNKTKTLSSTTSQAPLVPAVKSIVPDKPREEEQPSLLRRIFALFAGEKNKKEFKQKTEQKYRHSHDRHRRRHSRQNQQRHYRSNDRSNNNAAERQNADQNDEQRDFQRDRYHSTPIMNHEESVRHQHARHEAHNEYVGLESDDKRSNNNNAGHHRRRHNRRRRPASSRSVDTTNTEV